MLKINNINAYYGNKKIINNFSFEIKEKGIVAVTGKSGGGKSTLLNCINRFIYEKGGHYEGEIILEGINTNSYSNEELRNNICTVFQDSKPFPTSIEKNLKYVLDYYGVKEKNKKIIELLKSVSLYEEIFKNIKMQAEELSGGQKQRLCIARALACRPKVILLDEPCASLDPINSKKIEDLIVTLSEKMTILMVTHNLEQAKRISNKIIKID